MEYVSTVSSGGHGGSELNILSMDGVSLMANNKPRRMSIDELEKLLQREDECMLEILPNGEVREFSEKEKAKVRSERKPLTMRENLGGEYA